MARNEDLKEARNILAEMEDNVQRYNQGLKDADGFTKKMAKNNATILAGLMKVTGKQRLSSKQLKDIAKLGNEIASGNIDEVKSKRLQEGLEKRLARAKKLGHKKSQQSLTTQIDMLKTNNKGIATQRRMGKLMGAADKMTGGMASKAGGFLKHMKKAGPVAMGIGLAVGIAVKALKFASALTDKFGQAFGVIGTQSSGFKSDMQAASVEVISLGKSADDVVAVVSELSTEFGIGLTNAVGISEQILDTAVATGMATGEATKLFGTFMSIGQLTAEQSERLIENTYQLAAQNKVNPSAVLKDMADSSELIAKHGADNLGSITKAAIQARKMGINLKTVEKISDSMLNFQSSLTAEMEAEVLIGRNLELNKARQMALTGDMEGMTKEIMKNVGSEAEFNKLNIIQRQALARAVGMEATELAKVVANQGKTVDQAKSFTDLMGEDGMSALTNIMNQLKEIGATFMLELGEPIEKALMDIKENFFTEENIAKIKQGLSGIVGFIKNVAKIVYNIVAGIHDFVTFFTGGPSFDSYFESFDNVSGEAAENSIMGVNDFRSSGGSHLVLTPSGQMLKTNPRDTVFGTTAVNDFMSGPAGAMGVGGKETNKLLSKIVEQNEILINETKRGPGRFAESVGQRL